MKNATYFLSTMLMVACFTQPVSAQFEGEITYKNYEYSESGEEIENDEFSLFITPDRILLQGEKEYEVMGSIKTEGLLVRLDFQDFVFLTGDEQALKISKSDITSMMNMMGNGAKKSKKIAQETENVDYEQTGETETIHGYNSEKFIFQDEEEPNAYTAVWMTRDISVNWGMLAEPWSGGAGEIMSNFPTKIIFEDKYFPVKVEYYKNDKLDSMLEATTINESSVARAMVNVPSGVKVLSFQDYLFQEMNKQ